MAALADVAQLIMGQSPPSSSYNGMGLGLPFFQGKVDFGFLYPTPRKYCTDPKKVAEDGDILISVRAPVGPTNICSTRSCIGRGLAAIRPHRISSMFLYYNLRYIEDEIASLGTGSTFKSINKSQLSSVEVNEHDFPLSEQHRIAAVLSLVQRAIEEQERLIALTTDLKKALMHKLFTEGTRGEPQKQTEIGPIPESWEVVELQTTGDVVYGIQASVANNFDPVGTRILTNKNITLDGGFALEKINYFELRTKRHYQTLLKTGDLLFNWRSGSKEHVGKTAYFDLNGEFTHSSFILRIRPNEKVSGRFLYYFLNWLRETGYFVKLQTYAVNAKFNKSAINVLPTAKPSREEQDDISGAIDAVKELEDTIERKLKVLTDLFRTLLHQLMTAEIRVEDLDLKELSLDIEE